MHKSVKVSAVNLKMRSRANRIEAPAADDGTAMIAASDGELLMQFVRHRDEAAFAQVVERHGRLVWVVCWQVLRHHADVEDAFQATFLILAQRAGSIRSSDSAAAWLFKVAQRTAIAARRKRLRRREEELAAEPPVGDDALPLIQEREWLRALVEEVRDLPERYRTPIVLRYFENQSRRTIAEQTDSTVAQIQGRLVRGRRMLRSRLVRRGVSLSIAVGSLNATSSVATAGFTPALATETAIHCSAILAAGTATGAASPAVLELAKEGIKAMWYASMTKAAAIAVPLVAGVGIAWAAQIAGGDGASAVVRDGVELQAAAEGADPPAAPPVAIAAAEANRGAAAKENEDDTLKQFQKAIAERRASIEKLSREKVKESVKLEMQQLAKTLKQREVEAVHAAIMEIESAENTKDLSDEERQKMVERRAALDRKFEELTAELESVTHRVARSGGEIENLESRLATGRRQLEVLDQLDASNPFVIPNLVIAPQASGQPVPARTGASPFAMGTRYFVPTAVTNPETGEPAIANIEQPNVGQPLTAPVTLEEFQKAMDVLNKRVTKLTTENEALKAKLNAAPQPAPTPSGYRPSAATPIPSTPGSPAGLANPRLGRVNADSFKPVPAVVTVDQFQQAMLELNRRVTELAEENEALKDRIREKAAANDESLTPDLIQKALNALHERQQQLERQNIELSKKLGLPHPTQPGDKEAKN